MGIASYSGASSVIKPGVVTSSTRPSSPFVGQLVYETDTTRLAAYNGSAWVTQNGLQLVATATASTVTSVSINNCFTSTYENYRILFASTSATSAADLSFRLRIGGVDTTTNYVSQLTEAYSTSIVTNFNIIGADEWYMGRIDTPISTSFSIDVYRPQTAQKTSFTGTSIFSSATPTLIHQFIGGSQTDLTQFDGFTLLRSASFSGVVRVYGYANS
jgi:hypothetical protein